MSSIENFKNFRNFLIKNIVYGAINITAGVQEVQFLNISQLNNPNAYFILSFDEAITS